jgi:hypothetical protein
VNRCKEDVIFIFLCGAYRRYMYVHMQNGISEKDYQTWRHKTRGTKPGTKRDKLHKSNPESLRQKGVNCAWAHTKIIAEN